MAHGHVRHLAIAPEPIQLQAPVTIRACRPYESRSGTCPACNEVTKGRVELPSP